MYLRILSLALLLTFTLEAQGQNEMIRVELTTPRVKIEHKTNKTDAYIYSLLKSVISESNQFVQFSPDMDDDFLKKFLKSSTKVENELGSAIMDGSQFIIKSKMKDYNEKWSDECETESEEVGKVAGISIQKEKSKKCHYKILDISFTLELELASVETGEIVSTKMIMPNGWAYTKFDKFDKKIDYDQIRIKAYEDMFLCLKILWKRCMLDFLKPQKSVLTITESKKDKAKQLAIAGGVNAGYPLGSKMLIKKQFSEEINGQTVTRNETIGSVKINSRYQNYTTCDVKDGDKEILQAFNNGDKLFCIPDKNPKLEKCKGMSEPRSRRTAKERILKS